MHAAEWGTKRERGGPVHPKPFGMRTVPGRGSKTHSCSLARNGGDRLLERRISARVIRIVFVEWISRLQRSPWIPCGRAQIQVSSHILACQSAYGIVCPV